MITHKSIRDFTKPRTFVDAYIDDLKQNNPNLSVIDVGGGLNSWCKHTTHVVDIFVVGGSKEEFVKTHPERKFFDFDINQRDNWNEVLDYVAEHGKFDYCICTHTLEDIYNPSLVCEMLQKIAKRGFVSVPSKYAEYLKFESWYGIKGYRGFYHHKWVYSIKDNIFRGFEKTSCWEHVSDPRIDRPMGHFTEIGFMWEDNFDYKFYTIGEIIGTKYSLIFEVDDLPIN